MTQKIEAIYQNGMFKPLTPIPEEISEGEEVIISIKSKEEYADEILKLAENFYEDMTEQEIKEIEEIMLDRSNFFGGRTS